ncbi:DUF222 domain-containing protein [Modestobacter marinus]|uniref:DUF222 domain-containing protein n=1 Tax=Modestobacter marinus TaxID=477641 RepID=UPI002795D062|nr:HNH endonuclease [Modestobacter marinus]
MHGSAGELQIDLVWESRVPAPRLPVSWLTDEEKAVELQRVQERRAVDAAYEAELILALAAERPASVDPPPDHPGARRPGWTPDTASAPRVSEFFTAELSAILNLGRGTAAIKLTRALTWRDKLPATLAALAAGELDERRACALADVLVDATPEVAGQVEAALLGQAGDLSVYRLRDGATALLLQMDTAAAEVHRKEAEKAADVRVHPSPTDGRATLAADLPVDEAVECFDVVDQLARMLKSDGDGRAIGTLRVHVLSTLIRRPAGSGLPTVCANVTVSAVVTALDGTRNVPGEVGGLPITAAHLRDLLARIGVLGAHRPRRRHAELRDHRPRWGTAGHPHARRTHPAGPPRLATTPRRRRRPVRLPGGRAAPADRRLRTDRPSAGLRDHPRPALPLPRLRPARRLGRPRSRDRPLLWRRNGLHQPLLPVPLPPPAQDLRSRLALSGWTPTAPCT